MRSLSIAVVVALLCSHLVIALPTPADGDQPGAPGGRGALGHYRGKGRVTKEKVSHHRPSSTNAAINKGHGHPEQQRGQRPRRRVAHHNPTPAHDDAEEPDHDTEQILKRAEGRARAKLVTDALRGLNGVQPHPSPQHLVKGLNLKGHTDGPSGDLPAGAYRLSSINTAANHQPNLGPIAQHGSHGDMVYFRGHKRAEKFKFFEGTPANGGRTDVNGGLPAGAYRMATMTSGANHQPVHRPVAQHGSHDDSARNRVHKRAEKFKFFEGSQANGAARTDVNGGLPAGTYRVATMTSAANHQPVHMPVGQRGSHDNTVRFQVKKGH